MLEDRQEINGMLVTMDQNELDMVKMFCHGLISGRGSDRMMSIPLLLMMALPPTNQN